jgi:hypothetical protein
MAVDEKSRPNSHRQPDHYHDHIASPACGYSHPPVLACSTGAGSEPVHRWFGETAVES